MRLRIPLLLACLASVSAQAWGPVGHRQIADIAWSQLTPKAKTEIARILMAGDSVSARGRDSVYSVPNQALTPDFLEHTVRPIFAESANWADAIKGGKSSLFEERITSDNASSPGVHPPARGNAGEDTRCKTWHYYDKPIGGDEPARESNAIRALGIVEKELESQERGSSPDRKTQAYDLYWIEHVFGDLHQPLHCVSNFANSPKGDAGGNGMKLGIPSNFGSGNMNLHSYWDSGIDHAIAADPKLSGSDAAPDVTRAWLAEREYLPAKTAVADLDPAKWVDAGWRLAQAQVYKGIEEGGVPSHEYETNQQELCKRQALLAGLRLATYLNRVLGGK